MPSRLAERGSLRKKSSSLKTMGIYMQQKTHYNAGFQTSKWNADFMEFKKYSMVPIGQVCPRKPNASPGSTAVVQLGMLTGALTENGNMFMILNCFILFIPCSYSNIGMVYQTTLI